MDKYQFLRRSLPELVAEAERQGGENPRAQLIIELLEERDKLAAAAEKQSKSFADLPLCSSLLSAEERIRLDENLKPLLRFLGSPGDWGYETKLGRVALLLDSLRRELWTTAVRLEEQP
jgi:hypothetical protein